MLKRFFDFFWLARKTWLTRASRPYYSQFGEDAVLNEIINPKITNGFYVDVGAYHPKKFSNTYALYKRGWRGINIDLDPIKIRAFTFARPEDTNLCAAVSNEVTTAKIYNFSRFGLGSTIDPGVAATTAQAPTEIRTVETQTLGDILDKSPYAGREIDLLSIDVEGHDFQVLCSFDINKYRPKIVIAESMLRTMPEIIQSPIYQYLTQHGYQLVGWIHLSLVFKVESSNIFRQPRAPQKEAGSASSQTA